MAIIIPSGPLSEEDQEKVTERQRIVRRWLRNVVESSGFVCFCSHDQSAKSAGGISRIWAEQFWRVAVSYSGKILVFDSCWEIIQDAMHYSPMVLYPHIRSNTATWIPVGSGATSAVNRFYTVEYVDGVPRPVLVDVADIPAFNMTGEPDTAEWLGWAGGSPRHHTHPTTLAIAFERTEYSVVRGRSLGIGFDITGGGRAYTITQDPELSWLSVSTGLTGHSLTLSPSNDLTPDTHSVVIRVEDATGQSAQETLDITVT